MGYRPFLMGMLCLGLCGCSDEPMNNPYPDANEDTNTYYTSFTERPKHLDPARSYSSNEWAVLAQIYEPPLEYAYLTRPYTLQPLLASKMPQVHYENAQRHSVAADSDDVAFTVYTVDVKKNVMYQPHPAFAMTDEGGYRYHHIDAALADELGSISDFEAMGTRVVDAEDFIYEIKRLASPKLQSPIFGLMSDYIVGLEALRESLMADPTLNLRDAPLEGARRLSATQYEIRLNGQYPQFIYWLAMPFFAPMPWEADVFYAQTLLLDQNIQLDWYPVGTGPYLLHENEPARRILLSENPLFRGQTYPDNGSAEDKALGLTAMAGEAIPFIDQIEMVYEKESIPEWEKFLQGYYDASGIASDSFDQALQVSGSGADFEITPELEAKGINLVTQAQPSIFYWGFNMLDPIVGGYTDEKRALRQAISIALDMEEYVQIFLNGRGIAAQGVLPPGIFGYQTELYNKTIYEKNDEQQIIRKPISEAKTLMVKAGYPNGINPETQKPLVLFYDTMGSGSPDMRARYVWIQKQFEKLGIDLIVRDTQYNRFQDKMSNGSAQIFSWGWNADYPDPENFMFLLYGPNSKVLHQGENAANYQNKAFDELFMAHKNLDNTPRRLKLIGEMNQILQEDAPWVWGFYPQAYTLRHQWLSPSKPNPMARNNIKYLKIDTTLRAKLREQWNQPIVIWLVLSVILFGICICPVFLHYRRMQSGKMKRVRRL